MRDFVTMRRPETVLLGEIDTDPEKYIEYFGDEAVSGFRIDAAVHMVRQAGGGELRQGYWLLEHMRDFVTMRRPETVLLGEIDTDPE
ncbi:hypothetical protein D9B85_15075, partial [Corynebacterium diphtheriae]